VTFVVLATSLILVSCGDGGKSTTPVAVVGPMTGPAIQARRAVVENLTYDSHTQLFRFDLVAKPRTSAAITLRAHLRRAQRIRDVEKTA
jgi:hypothetical protein